ncbi:MAG: outer membrane protein assembly factor BamD [Bacteroidetes bacterium]|nr:outer membrane protein assembly factor BamD [Bacteroidota bacterium]MBU1719572.1 outer membrane protein assembly factor BamD [Bacteroidota bacterium]
MTRKIAHIAAFVLLLTAISCSKYEKLLKGNDFEKKYEVAEKYYAEGDYYRALQLFDDLLTFYRGTERAEKIMYYYGHCYYQQGDYLVAAYHFKNFVRTFINSPFREECLYMGALCYFMDSPDYYLDQGNTEKAIAELQLFINMYPTSKFVADCNKYIDLLRAKLEKKSFEVARLYFRTRAYKSAVVAFNNTLKDFPDTKFREEAMFLILKSNYLLTINSISDKQPERIKETLTSYEAFVGKFPESNHQKEASNMRASIEKLNKNFTSNQ